MYPTPAVPSPPRRLVVGISGASGVMLGIRALQLLRELEVETHLVLSQPARQTIGVETDWKVRDVLALASTSYRPGDMAAAIASGSFPTDGMIVIPCSIKTLSAVANSYSVDLLGRAADVTLKEGRPLVLVLRETPLHAGHLRLMQDVTAAGGVIFPPVPAFYTRPQTVDDLVDGIVGRALARLGIKNQAYIEWRGTPQEKTAEKEPGWPFSTLGQVTTLTLSTTGQDGAPHSAPVYFAAAGEMPSTAGQTTSGVLRLYFFSEMDSQHAQDLSHDSRAAVAIYPEARTWQEIRGVQMRGHAHPVPPGSEQEAGWSAYQDRFPFVRSMQALLSHHQLFVFTPDWVRLTDNRQQFGYKEERGSR